MIVGKNEFIGQMNGIPYKKISKEHHVTCASCTRKPEPVTLPLERNGFIYTGRGGRLTNEKDNLYEYPDGLSLIVIDFDVLTEDEKKSEQIFYKPISIESVNAVYDVTQTKVVRSGSGGIHIYYFVDKDVQGKAGFKSNTNITPLEAIDIRGNNNIIFAEGCKFVEHLHPYQSIYDNYPQTLTSKEFKEIFLKFAKEDKGHKLVFINDEQEEFTDEEVEVIPDNKIPKNPKKVQKIRLGFEMILEGKIDLSRVKNENGVTNEFQMWKLLYRELYNCGYNLDEAKQQLAITQSEYDETTTNQQLTYLIKDKDWNRRPTNKSYMEYFSEYLPTAPTEPTEDEIRYEINGQNEYATMEDDGIYYHKYIYTKDDIKHIQNKVFQWKNFEIVSKYFEIDSWYYNGKMNDHKFYGLRNEEILKMLKSKCGVSRYSNLANILWDTYIEKTEIKDISKVFDSVCGYTTKGFKLRIEDTSYPNDSLVREVRNKIFAMDLDFTEEWKATQIKAFIDLYKATDFDNKDTIIAYGIVSPFLYALRSTLSLMPQLYLEGDPNSGKTTMIKIISNKFFGHLNTTYNCHKSPSQIESLLCSSTFILPLDDVEMIDSKLLDKFKSFSTTEDKNIKKDTNQGLKINVPFQTPICATCNELPSFFHKDMAYVQRCIILKVSSKNKKKRGDYEILMSNLEDGFMLKLLYDFMKDKDFKFLLDTMCSLTNNIDNDQRAGKIAKILDLGKYLAKEILGLDLEIDYSSLCSHNKVDNEIFDLIKFQCVESQNIGEVNGDGVYYRPTNWVKSNVYKENDEYRYTSNNLNDLPIHDLKLTRLYHILLEKWKGVKYGNQKIDVNGKKICMKCLTIPARYIEFDEQQIIVENIMNGTSEEL